MAQPIPLQLAPRDPQRALNVRLEQAPLEHAEAVLAAYEVLQGLHDARYADDDGGSGPMAAWRCPMRICKICGN